MSKTTLPKGVSGKKKKARPGQYKRTKAHRDAAKVSGAKGGSTPSEARAAAARENGREGGRPDLYKPEYVKQMLEFFDVDETRMLEKTIQDKKGNVIKVQEEIGAVFPSFARFCRTIGVSERTLLVWAKKHEDFKEAYEIAKTHQSRIIQANALLGHYMQPFAILFAKNNMGWRDKLALTDDEGGAVKHEHTLQSELLERRQRVLAKITKMAAA